MNAHVNTRCTHFMRTLLCIAHVCVTLMCAWMLLVGYTHTCFAQEKPLPDIEDLSKAQQTQLLKHLDSGRVHYEHKKFDQGLVAFQKAYALFPHPDVLYRIAECQERLGKDADAIESYKKFLIQTPNSKERTRIEGVVSVLEQRLKKSTQASIFVHTKPTGATVSLNGAKVGVTPCEVPIQAGSYQLIVQLHNHALIKDILTVHKGKKMTLHYVLKPTTNNTSVVQKDTHSPLPPKHTNNTNNTNNKPPKQHSNTTHTTWPKHMTPWVVTGAGTVSFILATSFWLVHAHAAGQVSEWDAQKSMRTRPAEYEEHVSTRNTFGTLAILTTIGAVGGLTAGAILWVMEGTEHPPKDMQSPPTQMTIIPIVNHDGAGVGIHARF